MQLFLLGDFESNNGPGNANKEIRNSLAERFQVKFSRQRKKLARICEAIVGIANADVLIICSKSQINLLAIKAAKLMNKKIVYVMHGLSSYEESINNPDISENALANFRKYEFYIFENVDRVICVSKFAMEFVCGIYPGYKNKMDYIFNVVDVTKLDHQITELKHKTHSVLSVGGGMRRKNNLVVANAITTCSQRFNDIEYTVVGSEAIDGMTIKNSPYVTWINHLDHNELLQLMQCNDLYIQNSTFETFGLAVVEALYAGCSILLSNQTGCKDLFTTIKDDDLIFHVDDEVEIAEKIEKLLRNGNNQRLRDGFNKQFISRGWQAKKFEAIIQSIL